MRVSLPLSPLQIPVLLAALAGSMLLASMPSPAGTIASWVELVGMDAASIRVITDSPSCPALLADGRALAMAVRATTKPLYERQADPQNTPVFTSLTCEAAVPPGVKSVLLDGEKLPLPGPAVNRIVVIGDTGCRYKVKEKKNHKFRINAQDCGSETEWPFQAMAERAAKANPDLVIHVGDYLYREPCPENFTACRKDWAPGYGEAAWMADFFNPAKPLLKAAPWVMVRGNHENCARAADGWFRYFHHGNPPAACDPFVAAFVAKTGGTGFLVLDSADAEGATDREDDEDEGGSPIQPDKVAFLKQSFAAAAAGVAPGTWLLSHRPFNAVRSKNTDKVDNTLLQKELGPAIPPGVQMIVSGHIHIFESLSFDDGPPQRPPQLVVGTGGDELGHEPGIPASVNGAPVATPAARLAKFGYMVWDRSGTGWTGTLFSETGDQLVACQLAGRTLRCDPTP